MSEPGPKSKGLSLLLPEADVGAPSAATCSYDNQQFRFMQMAEIRVTLVRCKDDRGGEQKPAAL